MNAPSPIKLVREVCENCDGHGKLLETTRVAGEAFDADLIEVECDWCGGTGEGEPMCAQCGCPLDEAPCADCDSTILNLHEAAE